MTRDGSIRKEDAVRARVIVFSILMATDKIAQNGWDVAALSGQGEGGSARNNDCAETAEGDFSLRCDGAGGSASAETGVLTSKENLKGISYFVGRGELVFISVGPR